MFTHPVCFLGAAGTSTPTLSNTLGLDPAEFQRARLTDSTDFNFTTQYTFLVWVYPTDLSIENGIYNQFGSSLNFVEFSILSNGKMNFRATYGGTPSIDLTSDVTLSENNLYMIGFEITGSNVDFIINGFYDTNSGSFSVSPTDLMADLDLGRVFDGTTSFFFNGGFSLPMAFQESLNPVTVSTIYNSGIAKQPSCYDTAITDLYAFAIPLNDGVTAGQELIDVSGNGNNAFLFGTPTPVYDGEAQEIIACGAVSFTANTANLNLKYFTAPTDSFSGLAQASISLWIRFDDVSVEQRIYQENTSTALKSKVLLRLLSSGELSIGMRDTAAGTFIQTTTTTLSLSLPSWYMITAVIDTTNNLLKIYVNANLEISTSTAMGVIHNSTSTEPNNVGASPIGNEICNAKMGFVGFYDDVLSQSDVTSMYNSGVARCYNDVPSLIQSDLISFWELANWTGHTSQEITDQAGSNDLTNGLGVPFVDNGLSVECGGAPTETFNLLTESGDFLTTESGDNLILE